MTAHDGTLLLLDNEPRGLRIRLLLSDAARDNSCTPRT
ncbi:hypothetical protein ACVWXO_005848 [Bradyrhizobium sp. LM2.7]